MGLLFVSSSFGSLPPPIQNRTPLCGESNPALVESSELYFPRLLTAMEKVIHCSMLSALAIRCQQRKETLFLRVARCNNGFLDDSNMLELGVSILLDATPTHSMEDFLLGSFFSLSPIGIYFRRNYEKLILFLCFQQ